MPSVSTLFWASLPILLAALVYQIGAPSALLLLLKLIPDNIFSKIIRNLFSTTHCYVSVRTLSSSLPHAECFSVSNGKFSRVFIDDTSFELSKAYRTGHVVPGLWDGHGHLLQYGELLDSVDLFGSKSMEEVQERLVQYKTQRPEVGTSEQWRRGIGWDHGGFFCW